MGTIENRPRMLKEFLRDDSLNSCTSSSAGFTMYPRKKLPYKSKVQVVSSKSTKPSVVLLRSQSKRAISAIHKVINVVKFFHFSSVKSPLLLPRSISRKVSCKDKNDDDVSSNVSEVKVKVKDILRWKSFRDLEQDKSRALDFPSSPNRSIITATTTTSCSKNSSWCDSDFTAEELPLWCGENEGFLGKNILLGEPDGTNATFRNPEEEWLCEEYEQQSPISVLDSPFQQVEESISPYHPSLANIQSSRCIITRRTQELEDFNEPKYTRKHNNPTLEKAKHLISQFKESNDHDLILDFFMHELNGKLNEVEILKIAKSWINGKFDDYEWDLEEKRGAYVKDMEKNVCWNKFTQEHEEMCNEFEMMMLNELIDEVLVDLIIT